MTLKRHLQDGTRFKILRVQFWPPAQRKHLPERVTKWTPSKSKLVPSGGSSFGPFICVHWLQRHRAIRAENCKLKLISFQATSAGVLNWGGPCYVPAFSYIFRAKNRTPYFYHFFSFYSRGRLDLLRSLPRVALKPASSLASS